MITDDEIIERIAREATSCYRADCACWKQEQTNAACWLLTIRNAKFEVIDRDELERLRANQVPPGHVCIDPKAQILGFASEAFDCAARIHDAYGENFYVENTDEILQAYLRSLADSQKEGDI